MTKTIGVYLSFKFHLIGEASVNIYYSILSIWGWYPGISQGIWVDHAGASGYGGATFHADLEGDGVIDISVTWAGRSRADLPVAVEFEGLLWFA